MIGNRIKIARKHRGRSQEWLAEEIGVRQTSVSAWERGISDPTTENLSRIAQLLDASFEWLATGKGQMTGIVYEPARVVQSEALPEYNNHSEEQREFLRLFDKLPKSKREILLTFMREWIK